MLALASPPPSCGQVLELRVLQRRRCIQVWALVEFGRRLYRRQILCSRGPFTLLDGAAVKRQDMLTHDFGHRPLGGAHLASLVTGDLSLAGYQFSTGASSVIRRKDAAGEQFRASLVPAHLLDGLLPAALLQSFHFWNDHETLVGEPKPASKVKYTLRVHLNTGSWNAEGLGCTVERLENGRPTLLLLDLLEAPKEGSLLWRVASIFSRVDALAHVLAWGRVGGGLVRVELPRVGTAFECTPEAHTHEL